MALDSPNASPLSLLLQNVADGKLQLPDFQREWKWDDERVRSLIATLTLGYPMGVMMTLQTGGDAARFKSRPLAGAQPDDGTEPEQLLLDGQQRLTSLFQALKSGRSVETYDTRGKALKRWYYIDIENAIEDTMGREDAILSVPEDLQVRQDFGRRVALDLTTREKECKAGLFPLKLVFDTAEHQAWMFQYAEEDPQHRRAIWARFTERVLNKVRDYHVPLIQLTKETPKEAVCTVFEKVNTGGVALNVFELLTATYAGDRDYYAEHGRDFHLADEWRQIKADLSGVYRVLSEFESTDFLQAVCLLSTYERNQAHNRSGRDPGTAPAVGCRRKDMLNLSLQDYLACAPRIVESLRWVGDFLTRHCVFQSRDLPYRSQLSPLAAIHAVLGERADDPGVTAKLTRWYWSGVFGEAYGGSSETRVARDLEQVIPWVEGGAAPGTVEDASFSANRLTSLNTRNSAAYKGLYALLLKQECIDWYYCKEPIGPEFAIDHQVDISYIFPKRWCERNGIGTSKSSSIVNKTPLSWRASRMVGARSPRHYLSALERELGLTPDWMDDVVGTHLVEPGHVRNEDFEAFYQARRERLIELIEEASGIRVARAGDADEAGPDDSAGR